MTCYGDRFSLERSITSELQGITNCWAWGHILVIPALQRQRQVPRQPELHTKTLPQAKEQHRNAHRRAKARREESSSLVTLTHVPNSSRRWKTLWIWKGPHQSHFELLLPIWWCIWGSQAYLVGGSGGVALEGESKPWFLPPFYVPICNGMKNSLLFLNFFHTIWNYKFPWHLCLINSLLCVLFLNLLCEVFFMSKILSKIQFIFGG